MAMQDEKKRNFDPLANARIDRGSMPATPNRSPYADAVSLKDVARGTGRALDMATFGGMSALGRGMAAVPKAIAKPFADGMQRRRDNRAAFDAKLSQERARKAGGMVGVVQPVERPAGTPGQLRGLAGAQAGGQVGTGARAGVPVRGNPLQSMQQQEPSPLVRAATGARQPPQSQTWNARGADGRQVPMSPTGAGSTAAAVPLPAGYMAPSDRTAKGLMQTTLNGGAYRYTPSAAEQATLGKASYSDNLQGAAPMASGAQVRAWEQPGALADAPMRGGFVGSNGLTDEDRAENLAYWQNVRQGVTQDIQRRALTKAAFNPGMDRVDREGNIDTSMRQAAFAGLAGMAGGTTERAGEGKAKGTEDWKRAVALEAMKGGNALELEAMKQAGTSAETFRTLRNDQQKAVIDAVGFALPEPQEGGLGGVGAGGGGVTAGQRALALAFTSRLATQRGEDALSNPFALTQIAGTVGQAVQQYPYADYGAALAAARAEVKNPKQAEELAALFQKEQMAALEAALFGSGEAEERE